MRGFVPACVPDHNDHSAPRVEILKADVRSLKDLAEGHWNVSAIDLDAL